MLITNFQDAVCKCVDRVGFISDVFAIVQISDVKRSKLAIFFFFFFFKTFQLRTWLQIYMYRTV